MQAPNHCARFGASAEPQAREGAPAAAFVRTPKRRSTLRWTHDAAQRAAVVDFRARIYRTAFGLDDGFSMPCDRFDAAGLISAWSDGRVVGCATANQMTIRAFPERSIYRQFVPISVARRMGAIARPYDTIREVARLAGDPERPGAVAAILRHLLRQPPPTFMLTAAFSVERLEACDRLGRAVNFMPLGESFHGAEEYHGRPKLFRVLYRTQGVARRPWPARS